MSRTESSGEHGLDKDWQELDQLFHDALELSATDRVRFLDEQCGEHLELRRELESLLSAADQTISFARDAVANVAWQQSVEPRQAGSRLGPYQLLRQLGEGGMGRVYLARRADEVYRQQVAVKLMHPGIGPVPGNAAQVRGRAADIGKPQSREYRPFARWRHHRGRLALPGDGICRWTAD